MILARGKRRVKCGDAMLLDIGRECTLVLLRRWPGVRQGQGIDRIIGGIGWKRFTEVDVIAIEVHIVLVVAQHVREPIGIDRMDQQQPDAGSLKHGDEVVIAQRRNLAARAAKTLRSVGTGTQDQQLPGIHRTEASDVDCQFFAESTLVDRKDMAFDGRAPIRYRGKELMARLDIGAGKV